MTFDELWRLKPEPKHPDSVEDAETMELFADCSESYPAFGDLDEAEVSRFIEWLEEGLRSPELDDPSID
ncbi:MAG: hypothetical protein JO270_27470 [Acidobacteriaceae bacterium]|nr:hypothetical protein [Acidobacteriaceae bacterium]MBV8571963.1 hypothetical protein [Acidobacteriaceae bacterium]